MTTRLISRYQIYLCALLGIILFVPSESVAQQDYLEQLGPPPANAMMPVELGYINLNNGNLHLEVPLGSFPQRGAMPFEAKLVYDSRIWTSTLNSVSSNQVTFRPLNVLAVHPQAGWRLQVSGDPNFNQAGYISDAVQCDWEFYPNGAWYFTMSGFSWTEPNGTVHNFSAIQTNQTSGSPNCSLDNPSGGAYADDGSGLYMVVNNFTDITVYGTDGSRLASYKNGPPATSSSSMPSHGEDANGNFFSLDPAGNVVDTLGRTPVVTTVSGNNIFYDVLNAQGTRSRYTVTTETIPVSVPFYSTTLNVVQSITLPNNTSYQFGYDSGNSGNNWGLVNSVTLPTGGQVTYGYTTFTDASGNALNTNRWVSSRISPDGPSSYVPQVVQQQVPKVGCPNNSAQQQNKITNPDGSSMIYKVVLANQSSETDYFSPGGALLKQDFLNFNDGECLAPPGAIPIAAVPTLVSSIENIFGPSGHVVTTKKTYDYTNSPSINNPTKISEWNFFSGTAPANPDRIRQVAYSLTANPTLNAANIIGKPITITLTDSAGNRIAQTSFTYDNYSGNPLAGTGACQSTTASQPSPAAPQHDYQNYCTSNTTRGNVTQVAKWLNTTGALITTATSSYDDTGNLVSAKDALSNTIQFSFSPSFGLAYLTKITNPLNQVTTRNYDFNTGLQISETDPNGQITGFQTKYSYDEMGRLIETDYPDGGQSKINFNGDTVPLTVTTTELAAPDPPIVTNTTLDGLGRPVKKCLTDPEGDDCSDTDLLPQIRTS